MESSNLVVLSIITLKDRQFNILVTPEVAAADIEKWAVGRRDDTAAISFQGANVDMPEHIGIQTIPTALIAHVWQYSREEFDAREARLKGGGAVR